MEIVRNVGRSVLGRNLAARTVIKLNLRRDLVRPTKSWEYTDPVYESFVKVEAVILVSAAS